METKRAGFLMGEIIQPGIVVLEREDQADSLLWQQAPEIPPATAWLSAAEAFPELRETATAEGARFLGGVAVRGQAGEIQPQAQQHESSLFFAAQSAACGDIQAKRSIRNNVATDVAERLFKAEHQTRIYMTMSGGRLQQEGRYLTDIHRNTLEHTVLNNEMLRRTKHELRNALLFEKMHTAGVLDKYDAVVFSPSSTTMSQAEKKDYGFFVDTETCSIQWLSADGDDITLETAFVAGKKDSLSERHDLQAIQKLVEAHGASLEVTDGTDVIDQVILVPKHGTQGVTNIVEWYDNAAGGTFYGLDKPRQDYQNHARECQERAQSFSDMVDTITAQLISEVATFKTPLDAIMRLDELSERYCVERAVKDDSLNEAVFGEKAALHIQEARFFMQQGDVVRAEASLDMAQRTANSSSCPLFKGLLSSDSGSENSTGNNEDASEGKRWMNCPYCRAKVFADPCAAKLSCWDCTAMVVNGKIISTGNGGTNKRRQQTAETTSTKPPKVPEPIQEEQLAVQVDAVFEGKSIEPMEAEQEKQQKTVHAGSLAVAVTASG